MLMSLAGAVMPGDVARRVVAERLAVAGIRIDGPDPWDMQPRHPAVFKRILAGGSLGLGESYVDGWWECAALDEFFARLLRAGLDRSHRTLRDTLLGAPAWLWNRQGRARSRAAARRHYDLDPELFRRMLGEERVYSCGYWRGAETLEQAQEAKIDLVCRKLRLRPGMRALDIGCGWGAAARHAAARYGVEMVGITNSAEQAAAARERCRGLAVEIREQDYRELAGEFDAIFSIGMLEHVGPRNYRGFMRIVRRCLAPDGLFLLHCIGSDRSARALDAWLDRYIFPGAVIPSARLLTRATEGLFVIEDWQNFGHEYDRTLMAWHRRLEEAWPSLDSQAAPTQRRLWRYYLLCCAGSFRARRNQVWQLVLSPAGIPGGYVSVR